MLILTGKIGAGGRGGAPRTNAIDRDACSFFIRAAVALPSITKFLLVSAFNVRRSRAAWMDDESWTHIQNVNEEIMPTYYKAVGNGREPTDCS